MLDINHTFKFNFCAVPYIYYEEMSSTVSAVAISVDNMRLLHIT